MKTYSIFICLLVFGIAHAQPAKTKRQQQLAEKHKTWDKCLLIIKGDTISGKLKRGISASALVLYTPITGAGILFAGEDEKEETLLPGSITKLLVPGAPEGYREYYSIHGKQVNVLARPLVSGPCMLLIEEYSYIEDYNLYSAPAGNTYFVNGSQQMIFYIAYKGKGVLAAELKNSQTIFMSAVKLGDCEKIFADCPELLHNIKEKKYEQKTVDEAVRDFNNCIAR